MWTRRKAYALQNPASDTMPYDLYVGTSKEGEYKSLATAKANALLKCAKINKGTVSLRYNNKVFAKYEKEDRYKCKYTNVNTGQSYYVNSKGEKMDEHYYDIAPKKSTAKKTVAKKPAVRKTAVKKTVPEVKNKYGVKVGDIFYASWGYDQTNVDYFQVIRVTESGAYFRPIGQKLVKSSEYGHEEVMPAKNMWDDSWNPFMKGNPKGSFKKIQVYRDGEPYIHLASYTNGHPWKGRPNYQTAIGWGH